MALRPLPQRKCCSALSSPLKSSSTRSRGPWTSGKCGIRADHSFRPDARLLSRCPSQEVLTSILTQTAFLPVPLIAPSLPGLLPWPCHIYSRLALTTKAWSSRKDLLSDVAVIQLLGLSKWFPSPSTAHAAVTLLKSTVRPPLGPADKVSQVPFTHFWRAEGLEDAH